MKFLSRTQARPLIWFMTVLFLLLSAGAFIFTLQQRTQLMDQVREHADRELHLFGIALRPHLIMRNYDDVREHVANFGVQYPNIQSITVKAPDGDVVAEYRHPQQSRERLARSYCLFIDQAGQECLDIEFVVDLGPMNDKLARIVRQGFAALLLFAGLMGAVLWAILRRTAFQPLEQAVSDLNAIKNNLELRVAERTADWMMANKELKQEIAERETAEEAQKQMEAEREKLISDLRALLDAISASRREWQETFDSITDMISIHDESYTIVRANKAFSRNFGLEPRDVVGKKCYDLFHQGHSPVPQCPHHRTLERKEPITEEIHDPASGRIFLVSTFPFASSESNSRGIIHIARDITELKEKEMRLIMSERLASLGQMASGIAHEINNPLAAIAGCVDGLNRRIKRGEYDPDLFRTYLGIIKDEINRSKNITTSMLSVVRTSSYEKKQVPVVETIDKALEIIGFQGRLKQVEVRKIHGDNLPLVHGSEGELKQVFLIVLTNALDAMEDRGVLTISTAFDERRLFVDISDSGPGIPPELHSRVFDPFFTTKSERGGTGLGLPIASRIMTAHNGGIEILSDSRPGTTVRIFLPLSL